VKAFARVANLFASSGIGRSRRVAFAFRDVSSSVDGSGAPSINRPLALVGLLTGLLIALACAAALAASPAEASFKQTDEWKVQSGPGGVNDAGGTNASFGIAADPTSGDVFTGFLSFNSNQPENGYTARRINKWLSDGTPGTPALFGDTFSTASNYAGVAINPTTHNVYGLVDPVDRSTAVHANPKIAIFQPDGTLLGSFPVSTSKAVGIDVDASGAVYVPDPANGVVNKYDGAIGSGTFGNLLDTTSGSTLSDAADAAVDAAGNLYVADKSTNRVNEEQTLDLEGNTEGAYRLSFNGEHTGVDFTGDLSYAQGTGDINVGSGTADRTVLASGEGDLTAGSPTITGVSNAGSFTVGKSIAQENTTLGATEVVSKGATITAVNPGAETITMSKPAASSANNVAIASGSKVLTNVTNIGEFKVGMGIVGSGFSTPAGFQFRFAREDAFVTTITAVDTNADTLTLSDGVASAGNGSVNGMLIENVQATTGAFEVAQMLKGGTLGGSFFAPSITNVSGGNLVVADVARPAADEPGVELEASSRIIHNVDVTSGQLSPGLRLVGDDEDVPADAQIGGPTDWDLQAHTVKMGCTCSPFGPFGIPLTGGGTGVSFHADLKGSSSPGLENALDALPSIGAAKFGSGLGTAENDPVLYQGAPAIKFQASMGARDLPQVSCAPAPADPLAGGTGTCSVTTNTDGSNTPGRVAKFDSSLEFSGNFVPPSTNYTADAIAVDKSSGDVYVAGGNSDFANPQGVITGADAPDFSVKRYDSSGNELETVGLGSLTAGTYRAFSTTALPLGPAFGLSFDSNSGRLYTVGRATDIDYKTLDSVVKVFEPAHTLTVEPEGTGNGTVDADSGAIAGCSSEGGTCSDLYVVGDEVTLSATDGALSDFEGWSVEGQPSACPGTGTCTVTMDADTTVHATFTQTEENLTVVKEGAGSGTVTSNPAGIDCGATCGPVAFQLGGNVELEANADPGSVFTGWSGGGCSGTGTCTVTLNAATTVHATFSQAQDLTVVKEGTGTGTVTSNPTGIDCGSTCGPVAFEEGSSVELTASTVTADHSTFTGWSVTGQPGACPGTGTCTVTMNADTTVHATFTKIQHTVSVIKNGTGSGTVSSSPAGITCGGTCSASFNEAEPVVLTATAANHSSFTSWSGCDQTAANQCTVNVDAVENVTATFTLIKHSLTVVPQGNGAGTVEADSGAIEECTSTSGTCTGSYVEGATVVLTATKGPHSTIAGWSGCDSVNGGGDECTVTVNADTEVKPTFSLLTHKLSVAKTGSGTGTITCDGGACAASYAYGSKVTLSATAGPGSTFTGWSGAGCSGTGACVVTIEADTSVSAGFDAIPTPATCTVPNLKGKTLGQARSMLSAADCALGKVTKPKARKGHKLGKLVVKSSSPPAGSSLPAGGQVNVRLAPKPRKRHKH
jgi:hypothetical protein